MTCQVLLTPHERHPIRVPFATVWQVLHSDCPHFNANQADVLYEAPMCWPDLRVRVYLSEK